jgi:amino acid permease
MPHNDQQISYLVASLTAGCAGLALTSAILSKDQTALAQFFTTANSLFNVGAGAIIGLLAGQRSP